MFAVMKDDKGGSCKHICEDCGQGYGSKRNLRRHRNQVHDTEVSFIRCPVTNCRNYYFRREYLVLHLECGHKMNKEEARDTVKNVSTEIGSRDDLEPKKK